MAMSHNQDPWCLDFTLCSKEDNAMKNPVRSTHASLGYHQTKDATQQRRAKMPSFYCIDGSGVHNKKDTTNKQRRRSSVTSDQTRRSSVTFSPDLPIRSTHKRGKLSLNGTGFRCDYSLGESARSSSHMIIRSTPEQAFEAVNSLQKHDFAFVKRSDGSYSYAILAFRSLEPPTTETDDYYYDQNQNQINSNSTTTTTTTDSLEEYMAFVMCSAGSIKRLKKTKWSEYVRLVSTMDGSSSDPHNPNKTSVANRGPRDDVALEKDGWVPPSIISFVPTRGQDEDILF